MLSKKTLVLKIKNFKLDVELFNSVGQLVGNYKIIERVEIPITELAAGVYYCRVRSGEIPVLTEKVLKVR